ncbi:hypothetical protein RIF29_30462 [Crotalaria pallida]|uniref:Uncharacterized protein n=1 Tax=Crotalaria pallida TaxID=3830 RepID=A0AAN9HWP7_CROPI
MRRREKENEKNNLLLLQNSEELDLTTLESNHGGSNISKMPQRKTGVEELLNSENEKSDYDWLLAPPDSPLFPTLEKESHISLTSETETPNARPTALKPRVSNIQVEPVSRSKMASKPHAPLPGLGSSNGNRRPSPSRGPTPATSRSSTPSGRPMLSSSTPATSRSSTPSGRPMLPSSTPAASRSSTPSGRPTLPPSTKSSRPSTPTSRATITSAKPTAPPVRSSTPTRSTSRASTPTTARPSLAAPKISQRSVTPTLRSSTLSGALGVSAPPTRPSSASKARPVVTKNPVQSRGISPSVKSRPWEPSQMPGFSLEAPPNLKTSLSERPASVTRSRPAVPPNSRSSSVEASSNGKSKRQSSTPSKGRASSGHSNQSSMQALSRARFTDSNNESPVVIGTKMVERVVNMRKLAPPKNEDHHAAHNNSHGKSTSSDSSGFGLTLSKKSLDMAMRHMDIRRSMQGNNLRPLVTSIPASSMYSVRSIGSSKSKTISVSDSPLATSSTASSEPSVNNNSISYDGSEFEENDIGSERGNSSPISHHSR